MHSVRWRRVRWLVAAALLAANATPCSACAGAVGLGPRRRDYRVLRCRGGSQSAQAVQSPEFAMDASYWLDLGPRLLTTVKDMIRGTEKLLDHSAASLRALHHDMEEHGANLQALQDKADALQMAREDDMAANATNAMLDLTLEVQQGLMLHLGTVLMLAQRAAFLQDSVAHAERLIHGGVLQELQVRLP